MMLRDAHWAYIQYGEDAAGGVELYDMQKDPNQYTNLAKSVDYAQIVADFREKMQAKLVAVRKHDLPVRQPTAKTKASNSKS